MSHLALFLLGPPRIERDGEPVLVGRRKATALSAYLAVTGEAHTRGALATLLWPESNQARARASLRKTISVLRQALGEGWLEIERESLALKHGPGFWSDVGRFHDCLAECQMHDHPSDELCSACLARLNEAVSLYRDDFMASFALPDSLGFDQWQLFQSESLRREVVGALEQLVRARSARGEFEPAIAHAHRWLALDPLNESAHCLLMQLYTQAGQRTAALCQYRECVQLLEQELGIPPQEETTRLYQAIRTNRETRPIRLVSHPSLVCPHNLPMQPTPFVGREEELTKLDQLLQDPDCRLLTLVGSGGIGKSRLALQAAARRSDAFSHGVHFIPLVALESASFLAPAIADTLKVPLHGAADLKEQLLTYLHDREMLLLLDNFEHLLDGTQLLTDILESAPGVRLLVTSRERLALQWEQYFEVEGLRFPRDGTTDALTEYSAVRLFLQSAKRAYPRFSFSEEEAPFIVRICQFLEGMPLGIELAATWVEVFSCQHIAREMEHNLGFLATPLRDVPERHSSLQAVFDRSWGLLSDEVRCVCRRLSVFRGGFEAEAAQWVAGASPFLLWTLVRKSFLRKNHSGRYDMLEVVRQYAEERLRQDSQEEYEAHGQHCEYYAEFLCGWEKHLKGERIREALKETGAEIENVRAAWQWAVTHMKVEAMNKAVHSFYLFHSLQAWFQEGGEAIRKAAERLRNVGDARSEPGRRKATLGKILARQGQCHRSLGQLKKARELLQESLSILRRPEAERAFSLRSLGEIVWMQGEHAEAKRLVRQSLAIYNRSNDQQGMASCLSLLGIIAFSLEEYTEVEQLSRECLLVSRRIGHRFGIVDSLNNLGSAMFMLKEYRQARTYYLEALEIAVDMQSAPWVVRTAIGAVAALVEEGEKKRAIELVADVLHQPAIHRQIKDTASQLFSELEAQLPAFLPDDTARRKAKDSFEIIKNGVEQALSKPVSQPFLSRQGRAGGAV